MITITVTVAMDDYPVLRSMYPVQDISLVPTGEQEREYIYSFESPVLDKDTLLLGYSLKIKTGSVDGC